MLTIAILVAAALAAPAEAGGEKANGKKHRDPPPPPPPPAPSCPRNDEVHASGTVVLTFDDSYRSHLGVSRSLGSRGICATFYVISGYFREGPWYTAYLSADEIQSMAAAGHDVESHTVTHPDLTLVSSGALSLELSDSATTLGSLTGTRPRHLAYPYGAHNAAVDAVTATYYATGRGYTNDLAEAQAPPSGAYGVMGLGVEAATSLAQAKAYVDAARTSQRALVLVFHDIGGSGAYAWPASDFDALAAYVAQSNVNVRTVAQAGSAGILT